MNSLLRFLLRYHIIFLFIILEGISLVLISTDSIYQRYRVVSAARGLSGSIHSYFTGLNSYFQLREQNDILIKENLDLRRKIASLPSANKADVPYKPDTIGHGQYTYMGALVVNNSINKQHNYLTLKAGLDDGVRPEMGVISNEGIVGVVKSCSAHYSTVISLLNTDLKISAKLSRTGYFGSFAWDGINPDVIILSEIPQHADIAVGDSVVTSGYSSIFPEGILLGFVRDFNKSGGNFYRIRVELSADFHKVNYVYIINNKLAGEQQQLESTNMKND